jgi:rhodanese-related sulfurtransferase
MQWIKQTGLSVLILSGLLALAGCSDNTPQSEDRFQALVADAKSQVDEIDIDTLITQRQHNPKLIVIDVRENEEWDAGHIPGAIHINRGILERRVSEVIPDTHQTIVLYCSSGGRSALGAQALQKMGYDNVYSLEGGFTAWQKAGEQIHQGD